MNKSSSIVWTDKIKLYDCYDPNADPSFYMCEIYASINYLIQEEGMSRGLRWKGPRVITLLNSCTGAVTNDRNASPGITMDWERE